MPASIRIAATGGMLTAFKTQYHDPGMNEFSPATNQLKNPCGSGLPSRRVMASRSSIAARRRTTSGSAQMSWATCGLSDGPVVTRVLVVLGREMLPATRGVEPAADGMRPKLRLADASDRAKAPRRA